MISKLQNISADLIIYSVLASEYEKPDFKNDALAGVRANYFNSKCSPQAEKTEIIIDGKPYSLSYSMKRGEPLSWKISLGQQPVQTVRRGSDGSYSVMSYGENGVIFKRQFFGADHLWLRTEYYSRELENRLSAVLFPRRADGLVLLRLQKFTPSGIISADLYPSAESKKLSAALIYSNSGILRFDESFRPADAAVSYEDIDIGGFRFTKEAFISANVSDLLDLKSAPYLSIKDISASSAKKAEPQPVIPEPPQEGYSAYDQIERILFEAQKTNKNIFGELAGQGGQEQRQEPEKPLKKEKTKKKQNEQRSQNIQKIKTEEKQPEALPEKEPDESLDDAVAELFDAVGQRDSEEIKEIAERVETAAEEITIVEEPEPDSVINTKNGSYTYYGGLDGNKRRSGRGRTVTPDGLTSYDGEYKNDKRDGFGVCYYKEGSPNYIGDWKSGDRSGRGVGFRLSDGTMHAGKWNGNKPDGFGARFDKNGGFLDICTYVDGKRNGKSVSFDEDGNVVIRVWKNGNQVSEKIISD